MNAMKKRSHQLSSLEAARRWLFLLSVIFFVTGLIMTVFGFAGRIHADSDQNKTSSQQTRRNHLQIAGPVFLSVSVATCVVGGIYSRLVKSDWLERQVFTELERRGGPVKALAVEVIRHRVSPALFHDPELQHLILSRLNRRCSTHCSQGCGSARRYTNQSTFSERRRASSSVTANCPQPVHIGNRKRSSASSCRSAPLTDNVDQVPGIHIQHIEALPYHVAVVTTDCGSRATLHDDESTMSAAEYDNKHRYIIIHNELSSVSSLSRSRSRSSKASSINMNDYFSSFESDVDPTNVTMTTTSAPPVAPAGRRHSTQQRKSTRAGAAAAAAAAALQRRRYSCDVRRCYANDDDDDYGAMSALTNTRPLYRTSLSSPAVVALPPHHRRHRDNSVVLVEVVCDHQSSKQQARTPARPRPRSASGSPSDRSRAAAPVNGPASDSEITARRARSYEFSDSGGAVLQPAPMTFRRESKSTLRRKSSIRSTLSTTPIDEAEERQLDNIDDVASTQHTDLHPPLTQNDSIHIESDSSVEFGARRADTTREQVRESSHASTQCVGEASLLGPDDGQRRRRATVSIIENTPTSTRKFSVSSSAADMLAKLMCVRRKMKLTDNAMTTV